MIPDSNRQEGDAHDASYRFANVNPNSVFLLAAGAAFLAVACIYFAYVLIELAIAAEVIPGPPSLDMLAD